jgi:hypothetical protein
MSATPRYDYLAVAAKILLHANKPWSAVTRQIDSATVRLGFFAVPRTTPGRGPSIADPNVVVPRTQAMAVAP